MGQRQLTLGQAGARPWLWIASFSPRIYPTHERQDFSARSLCQKSGSARAALP